MTKRKKIVPDLLTIGHERGKYRLSSVDLIAVVGFIVNHYIYLFIIFPIIN